MASSSSLQDTALSLVCGRSIHCDFQTRPVFNAVIPLTLTFDLVPFVEISPDSLNVLMMSCSVDGGG